MTRISEEETDRGYAKLQELKRLGLRPLIWFNGVPQKYVVMADDCKGEILRVKLNDDGSVYQEGDRLHYELLAGEVVIRVDAD